MKIAVLGAGAWGTALAISLAARHEVHLWTRNPAQFTEMSEERTNRRYLPGLPFPDAQQIELKLEQALDQADLALVVVPTAGFRQVVRQMAELGAKMPLVWACKGFEAGTAKLPHQVVAEELGDKAQCGALSGPSFALEVARGLPTALTLASRDESFAHVMALELHSPRLRVYSSPDVVGVEVGGAVKNVMAIAAGISDGMGYGYNARAALITRGLAEIGRLGVAMGGRPETFMGLTGAGDLILTCTGDLSRNRTVGLRLAQGQTLDTILAELGHIAEGVHSAREVLRLAESMNVEMPITQAVCQVLFEGMPPGKAVEALLNREPKAE
ncbi:NAD(P)H-dependent glycerol-3-phosphate dehydrogenase [Sulfuricella denitrificans skB26]|uniref:Glycerol-3-phosphate dehydrogenase [NAD(P)+] n=1 Tax=Sulfuricella denitrificans (strain DSM 22764 / NBRC 105220 / skB26) TaxID=1163617 RepID=S6ADI2_SULDS|nr:NAD(P)H-dependent glycerol-3-phosphate dehydrogenase [Sulfuricella denitrificans]BAN36488.1 NAD(P)H-dependent glycerol-3-phosphate dehydrogenase [Sulfuricella denitrificans skB26]